jgi:hypothetical protein
MHFGLCYVPSSTCVEELHPWASFLCLSSSALHFGRTGYLDQMHGATAQEQKCGATVQD